ncbi:MAG: cupredoxin family copper-binding protein [Candidatus Saccharibacteria bacterium]
MNIRPTYLIFGLIVIILLALGGGIFFLNNNQTSPPSGGNAGNQTQNQTPATGTVNIEGNAFNPTTITINKGETITWQNNDSVMHRIAADDGSFDLGDQAGGAKVKFTFNTAGTFNYHCTIHSFMKGIVVVK